MTEYQTEATQQEKLEALRNDTLFSRQQNLADDAGGRYTKLTPTTVTGSTPSPYPQIPSGPWSGADPVPPEEPLGFSVEAMEPNGTPAEVEQSLMRKED